MKTIEDTTPSQALLPIGQIRLEALSVYNWGSFNGLHSARIDPSGTLVTGDNGSGKSTFIDGLMALLLPASRATFNVAAAQGDRSDRTLLSYMRGSFGSTHDGSSTRVRSKREGAVVTGLRALYRSDNGEAITLAALFWTTQSSNSLADVKRIYIVAKRDLELKEVLDAFGRGNARTLKQWLRNDPLTTCCDDSFRDYQELYRRRLHMENQNAPALLSRALGLKKIDDLTRLIRELVLEPSAIRQDAKKVVDEFSDLVAIHDKLVDARAQREQLVRLPVLSTEITNCGNNLSSLEKERDGLTAYLAGLCYRLWGERLNRIQTDIEELGLSLRQTRQKEQEGQHQEHRRHEDYVRSGGDRVEAVNNELTQTNEQLRRVIEQSSRYQAETKKLGLSDTLSESDFIANQAMVETKLSTLSDDAHDSQDRFAESAADLSALQQQFAQTNKAIEEIEARPDSNIDIAYQRLRDELVESLSLQRDQCMFIGELIDVKQDQRHWQGAIERALGGLRITLAVPDHCFSLVTHWLNSRHTGLHVRVQVVVNNTTSSPPIFKTEGYLRKLVWRDHPYRDWLKSHLAGFDLHCVANTEILDQTPFSMTAQGLIHKQRGRFEKKDQHKVDERRHWSLGFSNKARLDILHKDAKDLKDKLSVASNDVANRRKHMDEIHAMESLWKKLSEYRWQDIDAPYWQSKAEQVRHILDQLQQSDGKLAQARELWEQAKRDLEHIRREKEVLIKRDGELAKSLSDTKMKQRAAAQMADMEIDEPTKTRLDKRIGTILDEDLDQARSRPDYYSKPINRDCETWGRRKSSAEKSAIGIMAAFRSNQKWQVIALDWGADTASLNSYIDHLNELEEEGLPSLVEQFVERLNKHATQSLARIRQKLSAQREDILERINTINQVMRHTEFRSGSYLKLGSRNERYPHVTEFNNRVAGVLKNATSDDHEMRFRELSSVVETLEKASNPATANTLESLRLLDARHQMSFFAEEKDSSSDEILDVLESSSGKSGGEKESFAGTIVAASLAYVLTPEGHDRPIYSTVFLDEAFSNTAEAVSRRVLRVFKELHIHVNLITPYKNLNLARSLLVLYSLRNVTPNAMIVIFAKSPGKK